MQRSATPPAAVARARVAPRPASHGKTVRRAGPASVAALRPLTEGLFADREIVAAASAAIAAIRARSNLLIGGVALQAPGAGEVLVAAGSGEVEVAAALRRERP